MQLLLFSVFRHMAEQAEASVAQGRMRCGCTWLLTGFSGIRCSRGRRPSRATWAASRARQLAPRWQARTSSPASAKTSLGCAARAQLPPPGISLRPLHAQHSPRELSKQDTS